MAQKGMGIARAKKLATNVLTDEDVLGKKRKLITISLRGANQIDLVYGAKTLLVLQASHPLVELYVRKAHETGHEGVISSLRRSRRDVWVINGRTLAKAIKSACTELATQGKEMHGPKDRAPTKPQGEASCTECQLKEKKCMDQRMGPLPTHRVGPCPIFQSVGINLFGPIEYQGTVNRRQVGKGLGAIFICSATSAVHVEFMDTYWTDSFLMVLRRFMCIRSVQTRIQSDRGEQLVATSKQVKTWDFEGVQEWARKNGI
jgi:hypothetical protein